MFMTRTPDRDRYQRHMLIRDYLILAVFLTTAVTSLSFNLSAPVTCLVFALYALIGAFAFSALTERSDAKYRRRNSSTLPRDEYGRWIP